MTTKVTLYRVVHHFDQEDRLAVNHIYYAQAKVLLFWHTVGQAKTDVGAMESILLHEHLTKDKRFFGRLAEVWLTKLGTLATKAKLWVYSKFVKH